MITVTQSALNQIRKLISSRKTKPLGIRLGINTKGCSGLSYNLQYVDEKIEGDETLKIEDINVYVDPTATLFLIGTQIFLGFLTIFIDFIFVVSFFLNNFFEPPF